jgi:hypothetical protein
MIKKELDIISILDSVRKANALSMLILDKHQRVLADHQTINCTNDENVSLSEYPRTIDTIMTVDQLKSSLEEMEVLASFNPSAEINRQLIDGILCRNPDDISPVVQIDDPDISASRLEAIPYNHDDFR